MKPSESNANKGIAVIGAGIVGISSALALARKGYQVSLIDTDDIKRPASYGNGATINPSSLIPVTIPGLLPKAVAMMMSNNSPLFLDWKNLPKLLKWFIPYIANSHPDKVLNIAEALSAIVSDGPAEHKRLAAGTDAEKYIVEKNLIYLYKDQKSYIADKFVWSMRKQFGVQWECLNSDEYRVLEPALAQSSYFGVSLPKHAYITNTAEYLRALKKDFQKIGGELIYSQVDDISIQEPQPSLSLSDNQTLKFDKVIIAAGAWSGKLTQKLGFSVPLESERGYHVEFINPSIMPEHATLVTSGKFIMTPMDGKLRCAGLVEFGGLDMPENIRATDYIIKQVKNLLPDLKYSEVNTWLGHRPTLTDSLPIIDYLPGNENIILAFGHQHIGLTSGPKTGRLVANLVSGQRADINMTPYRASRFKIKN